MEILLGVAVVVGLGLAALCKRQAGALSKRDQDIESRDEEIRAFRAQLVALKRGKAEDNALVSIISNGAFDLVLLLDEERRIVTYNESASQLFNIENASGARLDDVVNAPDLVNLVQLALTEDENLEEQFPIDNVYYRARTKVIPTSGDKRFVGLAMQDISELVSLNRARRDLVANISHELRTPITRIRLIIEGLFLDADKPKRKASIQSLKEIAMETDALLWLAQELLDLSMIESGQAIMLLVRTPLKQVVDAAMERLEPQAEMKGLNIVSDIPPKLNVLCDVDQLKRVLGNLLHNAIKWSPQNDAITITASEQADEVTVSIFDNGPGVPEDLRGRVFERFYQADVSHSGGEGTGLGLAICKHIVEAHGGRIWAEGNGRGNGGCFLFTVLKADADFQDEASDKVEDDARMPATETIPAP